ncbi:hypothetical protein TURU_038810 [Turdus rufiventris]|nr:hypothetical protein TURU_038810 [Turdus rufiventris]
MRIGKQFKFEVESAAADMNVTLMEKIWEKNRYKICILLHHLQTHILNRDFSCCRSITNGNLEEVDVIQYAKGYLNLALSW